MPDKTLDQSMINLSPFSRFLKGELLKKQSTNPSYSIRAFSKQIGYDQSFISKVLKGQKKVGIRSMIEIAGKLKISADILNALIKEELGHLPYTNIESKTYDVTTDWLPWALMECIKKAKADFKIASAAKELGVEEKDILVSLDRLNQAQLIRFTTENKIEVLSPNNKSLNYNETNEKRKALMKEYLQKSIDSIDLHDLTERTHLGLTVAIPISKIEEAKKRLVDFHLEFADFLQTQHETQMETIYHLGISFFPLSTKGE